MEREILFASMTLNAFLLIAVIGYRIKCKNILDEFHRILNGKPPQPPPEDPYKDIPKTPINPSESNARTLATLEDLEEVNPKPQPFDPNRDIRKIGRYDRHW